VPGYRLVEVIVQQSYGLGLEAVNHPAVLFAEGDITWQGVWGHPILGGNLKNISTQYNMTHGPSSHLYLEQQKVIKNAHSHQTR
jgi:hypothetical protein